jgi:hypothetical protein
MQFFPSYIVTTLQIIHILRFCFSAMVKLDVMQEHCEPQQAVGFKLYPVSHGKLSSLFIIITIIIIKYFNHHKIFSSSYNIFIILQYFHHHIHKIIQQ